MKSFENESNFFLSFFLSPMFVISSDCCENEKWFEVNDQIMMCESEMEKLLWKGIIVCVQRKCYI